MTPYAIHVLPPADIELWHRIRSAVEALPDLELGQDENGKTVLLSCHILARAVAKIFGLECQDGYFGSRGFPHSWVVTPHKNIIDVYPVGILGGVLLVDGMVAAKGRIYGPLRWEESAGQYTAMLAAPWFTQSLEKVEASLCNGMKKE